MPILQHHCSSTPPHPPNNQPTTPSSKNFTAINHHHHHHPPRPMLATSAIPPEVSPMHFEVKLSLSSRLRLIPTSPPYLAHVREKDRFPSRYLVGTSAKCWSGTLETHSGLGVLVNGGPYNKSFSVYYPPPHPIPFFSSLSPFSSPPPPPTRQ